MRNTYASGAMVWANACKSSWPAKLWPARLCQALLWLTFSFSAPVLAADATLRLAQVESHQLSFVSDVALKAEAGAVEKLLRTQPSHDWHCEFERDSNQQIRCQIGALQIDPVDIPGPSTLQFEIQAGALQTASQGRNRRLRGSFSTGLPSLLLESQDTDARGLPRVTLYSDFPISEDSVATHLYFQQGARRWAAKIAAAPISTFTERESFVINYPQSSGT